MKTANARQDGFYLLGVAASFSLCWALLPSASVILAWSTSAVYAAAQCLIQHHDPYQETELGAIYKNRSQRFAFGSCYCNGIIHWLMPNFPTTFLLVAPFALLPWKLATFIWTLLTAAAFICGFSHAGSCGTIRAAPFQRRFFFCW